jgi:hypothetical protein
MRNDKLIRLRIPSRLLALADKEAERRLLTRSALFRIAVAREVGALGSGLNQTQGEPQDQGQEVRG